MSAGSPGNTLPVPLSELLDIDWDKQAEMGPDDLANAYDLLKEICPEHLPMVLDDNGK